MTKVICHYSLTKAEEDVYFKTKKNSRKFFSKTTRLFILVGGDINLNYPAKKSFHKIENLKLTFFTDDFQL